MNLAWALRIPAYPSTFGLPAARILDAKSLSSGLQGRTDHPPFAHQSVGSHLTGARGACRRCTTVKMRRAWPTQDRMLDSRA